jgi:hypothetical protein
MGDLCSKELCARDAVQDAVDLPKFVSEHDKELSKHPLMDYGIAADVQETPLPQLASLRAAHDT